MLYKYILQARKKDTDAMLYLIQKFYPLLLKYSSMIHEEDSLSEIILFFLELLHHIPSQLLQPQLEGKLVNYIVVSIRNYPIHKRKERALLHRTFSTGFQNWYPKYSEPCSYDNHDQLLFDIIKEPLSNTEYEVIVAIYFYQYSVSQVALFRHISRQAVNQTRIRALKKLKPLL